MKRFETIATVALFVASCEYAAHAADADIERACRPHFGNACSEAMGRWISHDDRSSHISNRVERTTRSDAIVDPAGIGPEVFLDQRGAFGGSLAVFGGAGPPKAHVVYDPLHRIAYYDVGCCSWHRVVVAADMPPPPRTVTTRTLTGLRTERGIRLGDSPKAVTAAFGSATAPNDAASGEIRLTYVRTRAIVGSSPCETKSTFTFRGDRLVEIAFDIGC